MDCTQTCNQGRTCTCGQITPATYRWIVRDILVFRVVTFGRSKPGETISAAAYRADVEQVRWFGWFSRRAIDFGARVFFGQRDHCRLAWEWQRSLYK